MSTARSGAAGADLWQPTVNPWIIAAAVSLAAFMEVLDTSIANVALPHIAGSLAASNDESTWVLTSYLVSNAIVLPHQRMAGRIAGAEALLFDLHYVFYGSSFLCGIAPSLGFLLLFRVMQGAFGGGLQPMAQSILGDSFPPEKRGLAFSLVWNYDHLRSCYRSNARGLDHRQLLLALDFLHQRSRRHSGAHTRLSAGRRSTVHWPA